TYARQVSPTYRLQTPSLPLSRGSPPDSVERTYPKVVVRVTPPPGPSIWGPSLAEEVQQPLGRAPARRDLTAPQAGRAQNAPKMGCRLLLSNDGFCFGPSATCRDVRSMSAF